MAKKKVNVALIGAQFMGKTHSNAWRKVGMFFDLPVEPVMKVLCGKFPEELAVADKYGWQETSLDWEAVVNRPDIDIVDVCTPNFLHPPIAIAAAKAGKAVICEKPLATTVADGRDMVDTAARLGRRIYYAEDWLGTPALNRALEIVESGAIGDLKYVRARECHSGSHSPFAQTIAMVDFKRLPKPLAVRLASQPPFGSQRNFGAGALDWAWLAAG
ncbi:MAG TPA: Gfo/Idh/MocA family oxidoreductase, partial [Candidatus Hydrogenedentes bacterium]|nr:Gfo/Idh/MocA family oxidoreductase [Candidatus Hydrogenedentota bacterium]